ncbi:DEAD/DEAH box helicase, partial [Desulfofundulus sp.]|uniref:DEAD/DEAH box helicase n=1 Tax=Desulfofundulus sp. TaxID=2282750 RepID=UPI003C7635D8
FAQFAKEMRRRTLVLVHRDKLVRQTVAKFRLVWPEADVGIIKAAENELHKTVTVASVQTLSRVSRLKMFLDAQKDAGPVEVVIVDESHHAVARTYRRVLDAFPDAVRLGFTATPARADKISLGEVFDEVAVQLSIGDLVRRKYLVPLRGLVVRTETELDGVKARSDDFVQGELAETVNTVPRNREIVRAYIEHGEGRKAVAFCASVGHAADLASEFNRQGVTAAAVSCHMGIEDRREVLEKFMRGEIQVVTNYGILTEGFDDPSVQCIIMARPTKNRSLYIQMVGRGARIAPGKKDCLVLDVVDISRKHRLVQLTDLRGADGRTDKEIARDQARALWREVVKVLTGEARDLAESGVPVSVYPVGETESGDFTLAVDFPVYCSREIGEEHERRAGVLRAVLAEGTETWDAINSAVRVAAGKIGAEVGLPEKFAWTVRFAPSVVFVKSGERKEMSGGHDKGDGEATAVVVEDLGDMTGFAWVQVTPDLWVLQLPDLKLSLKRRGAGWVALCERREGTIQQLTPEPMPLDWALNLADSYIKENAQESMILVDKNAGWRGLEPTEKQIAVLREYGLPVPRTRGEASVMIGQLFAARGVRKHREAR